MKQVVVLFLMISAVAMPACGAETGQAADGKGPVEVSQKYEYYDVHGNTADQIRQQMNQNGTKWDDGQTYDSVTTWNLNWTYDYDCSGHSCTARSFKTTVAITFRFPRWIQPADAPADLVARWNGYMQNLIVHENGHADMAVEAAEKLSVDARSLSGAASPADLDRQVQELAGTEMAKLNVDEKEYDTTTVHGTTQGAVFP